MRGTLRVLLLLVVVATGCTSQQSDTTSVTAGVVEAEWLLHSDGPPITSMSAGREGTLRIDLENRCVTLDDGVSESLLVFGDNATLDISNPDEPVLAVGGARFRDGDHMSVGGGGWSLETMSTTQDPAYQNLDIPASCAEYGLWIVAPFSTS